MAATKIEWTVTRIDEPITCYTCHGTGKVKKVLEKCPTCDGVGEIDTLPGWTYNPWSGCAKISPGCRTCYAETLSNRWRGEKPSLWGVNAERKPASPMYLLQPHPWNKLAESINVRLKVFCASMADVFEDRDDLQPHRDALWKMIEKTPMLDWLLLSKRPVIGMPEAWSETAEGQDITKYGYVNGIYSGTKMPRNIWLGHTIVNNEEILKEWPVFYESIKKYRPTVAFLSLEPLLGPMPDFGRIIKDVKNISGLNFYVIVGGESGNKARPMRPDWVKPIQLACLEAGIPFFFKQWGEWAPASSIALPDKDIISKCYHVGEDGKPHQGTFQPGDIEMVKLGKGKSGRMLNDRHYNDMPVRRMSNGTIIT